jgi:hypothetical protein
LGAIKIPIRHRSPEKSLEFAPLVVVDRMVRVVRVVGIEGNDSPDSLDDFISFRPGFRAFSPSGHDATRSFFTIFGPF